MVLDGNGDLFRIQIGPDLSPAPVDQAVHFPFIGSDGDPPDQFRSQSQLLEHSFQGCGSRPGPFKVIGDHRVFFLHDGYFRSLPEQPRSPSAYSRPQASNMVHRV